MRDFFKRYLGTFVVASVVAAVMGGVPAFAHLTSLSSHDLNHLDKDYTKTIYRRAAPESVPVGTTVFNGVSCPGGYVVMGGGAYTSLPQMFLEASYPTQGITANAGHNGWGVYVRNTSGSIGTVRAYAVCRRAFVNPGGYPAGSPARSAG